MMTAHLSITTQRVMLALTVASVWLTASCVSAPPRVGAEAPATAQSSAEWYADYLAHGRLVQLPNGRALNLYCVGSGSPTVVLEAGLGGFAFDWRSVQSGIAATARVCAYDRAGLGASPAGPNPRDTQAEVSDLEALLPAAGMRGPYVLVGHSMGGYNVRLFASRHLHDVAGIVLVDPSAENQIPVLEAAVPEIARQDVVSTSRARACANPQRTAEVAAYCVRAAPADLPENLAQTFVRSQDLAQSQTFFSEVESFLNVDSREVEAEPRSLGAVPLIVLTRTQRSTNMSADAAETEWQLWNHMHDEIAALSTRGSNRAVQGAGHYIQLDQPRAVIDAVSEVIEDARGHSRRSRASSSPH